MLVQALAGLAQAGSDDQAFVKARKLWDSRTFNFSSLFFGTHDIPLLELARGAWALGRGDEARQLRLMALDYGSIEPLQEVWD